MPDSQELSILTITKTALGIDVADTSFDVEIAMFINAVFSDLTQLGLGPAEGFSIQGYDTMYSTFLGPNEDMDSVKSYMYMRVRLLFDPPDNYFVVKTFEDQISKAEFRLNVAREDKLMASVSDNFVTPPTPDTENLDLIAGLPYSRRIRVVGAALVWPTLDSFEVRSQIREYPTAESSLRGSLNPYLTPSIDVNDILIDLSMTGQQTREVPVGYYDLVLSDPGTDDARAILVLSGKVKVGVLTSGAANG